MCITGLAIIFGLNTANATPTRVKLFTPTDASLKTLSVSTGTALTRTAGNAPNIHFSTSVAVGTTSVTFAAVVSDPSETITYNGNVVASGSSSPIITLNGTAGSTTSFTFQVKSGDGTVTNNFTISVLENGSNNAGLKTLSVSNGSALVRGANNGSTITYTTTVSNGVNSVTVTPTAADAAATITVNGVTVASGTASQAINLTPPTTTIGLTVTAQDGTQQAYSIAVTSGNSNDATLATIWITPASTLTQVSGPSTVNYNAGVSPSTTSVTVTATTNNTYATLKYSVNGGSSTTVASGSATPSITLTGAMTAITVTVTAQDGVTVRTYTINVNKTGGSDASLKDLALNPSSALTTVPTGPGNTNYVTTVSQSLASLRVIATASDPNATITVDYKPVASGAQSQPITLTPGGSTFITIQITAQNGTTVSTLSIDVTRAGQNTYNWTGMGGNSNWNNAANWSPSGVPAAGDEAMIGSTNNNPVVNVASTVSALTITGSTSITLNAPLTATASTNLNAPLTLTGTANYTGAALTGAASGGTAALGLTTAANTNTSFTTITLYTNSYVNNAGTLTASSNIFVDFQARLINSGLFNSSNSTIALQTSSYINNIAGGTFNITNSPQVNMLYAAKIGNSGIFNISGSNVNMGGKGYIENASGAVFSIYGNSTIGFAVDTAASSKIQNDGTFYAGTVGSPVTINLDYAGALLQNNSIFTLANTSVINMPGDQAQLSNTGTFTFVSDQNSSATLGPVTGNSAQCFGTFTVQRYMSGSTTSSAYRSYRLLSSPVHAATVGGLNVYSINYAALLTPTSGAAGGGFTQTGNPTFYFFRGNLPASNATFTSGNYRGIDAINNSPAYNYTVDGDAGNPYTLPIGNGFLFFYRGNMSGNKFVPGTDAESVTYNITGLLNVGSVTAAPWFTPGNTNLDYTPANVNNSGTEFALVGNPYASSINWNLYGTTAGSAIYAPNVAPTIYELNPTSHNYDTYDPQGGIGGTGRDTTGIIVSGEGFFVQAGSTGASLTFTENAKTTRQVLPINLYLGKPAQQPVAQYLHLKLMQDDVNVDDTRIRFSSTAASKYVFAEDAPYKIGNGSVSLSSMSADGVPLAINGIAFPKNSLAIPLNVNATNDGTYRLNMKTIKSIPELYDVFLIDTYKKDSVDMRHTPTYSFNISKGDALSFGSGRFSLVIRQNPALALKLVNFAATKVNAGAQVVWKTLNEANYTNFTVERSIDNGANFDVLGGYLSSSLGTYSYTDNTALKGVNQYRLKLQDVNGSISYSNIVTLMISPNINGITSNINIYPNPSNGVINLTVNAGTTSFASLSSNKTVDLAATLPQFNSASATTSYNIKIISVTGAIIKTATSSSPAWQDNVSSLSPGTYFIQVTNKSDNSLVGKGSFVKL